MLAPIKPLVCPGHTQSVHEIYVTDETTDGVFIASACQDRSAMLRDGDSGDWIGSFQGHKGAVWSAHLDPTATRCATGSADFTARLWDATTGDQLHEFAHQHVVKTVRIGGTKLLTGGNEKRLRIYDLFKPDADPVCTAATVDFVKTACWSLDQTLFYSGSSKESALRVWDSRNMELVESVELPGPIFDLEPVQNGRLLTIATRDKSHVLVFDCNTRASPTLMFDCDLGDVQLESASLHPRFMESASAVFATGESGNYHGPVRAEKQEKDTNWVRVWDLTGKELYYMKGHHGPVHSVRWHPDGHRICSGSDDGTVRLWQNPAENGKP